MTRRVPSAERRVPNYINGALVAPAAGRYLDNIDPATGTVISLVPDSDESDVAAAVAAAVAAFRPWAELPASERSRYLTRIADRIEARLAEFARAESIDTGKPLALATTLDIPRAAANFRFFATAILHTAAESHATDYSAINYTLRRPRGVAGLISPWNLPLYLLSWKIAPAIATGNTAVAKPSELTPTTAALLAEVCQEVGLPPGVLNLVHGLGASAGAAIVAHPAVKTISFTGGTATGATIARSAAPVFKKLTLELGGKNPTIIFADTDLDQHLGSIVRSSFANQGEICLCGSRILVEQSLYDQFVARFTAAVAALTIGDPLEPGTDLGPLISAGHRDKVMGYIALARSEGGVIRTGGGAPATVPARCANGYYVAPTVIANLPMGCRTNQEEIFGPVVTVMPFRDEAHAIELANDSPYGLAASLWTNNLTRAHRVAEQVQCGTIWVNCWLLRDLRVPFGGMRQSGVGREGGDEAIRFFTEPKNVCIKL
ncbi:MAG: aldehyde dehydrogenase [Gemmatimonadetes bacterium]|nr:aldehyde dehydrogenase [Gemmatimonadota bacterium]